MRWYVEVTSSFGDGAPERWVVEAAHWQPALEQARRLRGDDANLRGFSIELLDDGCRAVDPQTMAVYTVRPAPAEAALSTRSARLTKHPPLTPTDEPPAGSRPRVSPSNPPGPADAEGSRAERIAAMLSIDKSKISKPPPARSKPPAAASEAPAAANKAPAAVSKPPAAVSKPPAAVSKPPAAASEAPAAASKAPAAASKAPAAVSKPPAAASEAPAAVSKPPAAGIQALATVFQPPPAVNRSSVATGKPPAAAIEAPVEVVRPAAVQRAAAASTAPAPASTAPAGAFPLSAATRTPAEAASQPPAAAPDRPVFEELPPAHLLYERSEDATPTSRITYRESAWSVPSGTPVDVAQRLLVGMFEGLRASLADAPPGQIINMAVFDFRFEGRPPGPPLVSLSWKDWKDTSPIVQHPSIAPGRRSVVPSEPPASVPAPASADGAPTRRERRHKRLSGDELIAALFESMHEVHFVRDSLSGAKFVLSLILDKLPTDSAVVHFFDINALEFVVVRAVGRGSGRVLLCRTPEKDPLIARAMGSHRAVVVADANGDPRMTGERWERLGLPVRSVIVAPVEQAGRFLGLIELVNPRDGGVFSESDGHGLTYLGEQFGEFLAARGVVLDPERIEKG